MIILLECLACHFAWESSPVLRVLECPKCKAIGLRVNLGEKTMPSSQPSNAVIHADDQFNGPDGHGKYAVINRRKFAAWCSTLDAKEASIARSMLNLLEEQGVLRNENLAEPNEDSFFVVKMSDPYAPAAITAYTKEVYRGVAALISQAAEKSEKGQMDSEVVQLLADAHHRMDYGLAILELACRLKAANLKTKLPD